ADSKLMGGARLANARLTHQHDQAPTSLNGVVKRAPQCVKLNLPPNEDCVRGRFLWRDGGCGLLFPLMRDAIDVNRSGYVFQINLANIFGGHLQFTGDLFLHLPGDANSARLGNRLETGRNVNAIPIDAGFVVHNVAEIDANPVLHAAFWGNASIAICHHLLDRTSALDSVKRARELSEDAVACSINNPAAVIRDHWGDDGLVALKGPDRSLLIPPHERAIAGNICGENGC